MHNANKKKNTSLDLFRLNAKVCGGNRSLDAKERFPPRESNKGIDTDLPFPMLYGGKRKGLIAIPTRFCIEPLFHVKQRRAAFTASKNLRNRIEKYFPNGTEPCIMFTAFRSILVRLNCAVKRTMHGTVKNRITIPAFHQIFISKPISNAAPLRAALTPGWNARSELC